MDAKPQRPRVRVYGDENALPATHQQKAQTLHSRHKSQPALKSVLATAATQKLGPRKAFGDVSNVTATRTFKDDSAIKAVGNWEKEKLIHKDTDVKPAPIHSIPKKVELPTIKAIASHAVVKSTNANSATSTVAKQSPEILRPQPVKAVRKSRTTVFQERPAPEVQPTVLQQDLEIPRVKPAPILPCESYVPPAQVLTHKQPKTQNTSMKLIDDSDGVHLPTAVEDTRKQPRRYSYAEDLSLLEEEPKTSHVLIELDNYESAVEYLPEISSETAPPMPKEISELAISIPRVDEFDPIPLSANTVPDHEEYWDEEEDDGYAEDGYVTARSFKSTAENITGNATRTLYPRVDQAVKRELAAAKILVESTRDPEEIEDEQFDPTMVAEYNDEIFQYMRDLEQRMAPNPHYMDKQNEIQWSMRAVLMDWIVQVHHRFGLLPETLFLTVNLIDRFLSQKVVSLTKLQLVGATAIFVAAKYEEVDCPSIQEVQFMVDNGYKIEEILKAERFMLSMLGFELGFPGPMSFLRRISKADDYDLETRTLAKYFIEITIMDERFLPCVSSFIAAGAHCLARLMLRKGNWSPAHVYYSDYTYSQLQPLVSLIAECCDDPQTHHAAIFEKYLDKRYKKAASYVQMELQRGFRVPFENVIVQSPVYATHPYNTDPRYWDAPYVA